MNGTNGTRPGYVPQMQQRQGGGLLGLSNNFLSDALSTIGTGLLGIGSGRDDWGLLGMQNLQQRQQDRLQNTRQATQDSQQAQMFEFQKRQAEAQQQAAQQGQAQQAAKAAQFQALLPTLPANLQPTAEAMGPDFLDAYGKHQIDQAFPDTPSNPASVQEYEYAKAQGFTGSLLDYEAKKSAASRAPQQAPDQPADVREYQFAVGQGFKGSYLDYLATKKGGGMSVTLPDGTVMQMGGSVKPPTEGQGKAANQYTLLSGALDDNQDLITKGGVSPMRMAGAETLSSMGPIPGVLAQMFVLSPEDKQFQAGRAAALESLANSITGAAFSDEQKRNFIAMMPQATDDAETSALKMKRMHNYLAQLQKNAGPALNQPGAATVVPALQGEGWD